MSLLRVYRVFRSIALVVLLLGSIPLPAPAVAREASTVARELEPVVVQGLAAFDGAPVADLCAYRYTGNTWKQIPFQVDEKDGDGNYVTSEDDLLDANDEVVFMASDLGALSTTSIDEDLSINEPWYRIDVTDPLDATAKGWAYLVNSATLDCDSGTDYVDFIEAASQIVAQNYTAGWAAGHNGFEFLSLFNGPDVLDRTKIRARTPFITLTENDIPVEPIDLVADGPVRVITARGGALTLGYASLSETTTPVPLDNPLLANVTELRISTDLAPDITGTYYDENTPNGVSIDGNPDVVAATPLVEAWRQTSLASGTIIETGDLSAIAGTYQHYYQDQSTCGSGDTGDGQCWGDSGFAIANPSKEATVVTGRRYILPADAPNQGSLFYNRNQQPLAVSLVVEGQTGETLYLPFATK